MAARQGLDLWLAARLNGRVSRKTLIVKNAAARDNAGSPTRALILKGSFIMRGELPNIFWIIL
jgi:hypothetical protein